MMFQLSAEKYSADIRCNVAVRRPGEQEELKPARLVISSNHSMVEMSLAIGDGSAEDAAGIGEVELTLDAEGLRLVQKALKQAGSAVARKA
uniref:Uncharacterized protein n=1 Tax=Desulfobacca acetoxidans TaxID=60893 RepID=A0A7V4G7J2_9BACT